MPEPTPASRVLGALLRASRTLAGLSMDQLVTAGGAGWSKATVSRAENGKRVLDAAKVEEWLHLCGATPQAAAEIRAALETVHRGEMIPFTLPHGPSTQIRYSTLEAEAGRIVVVQAFVVPGLLQTAAYARGVLELFLDAGDDVDSVVDERMIRQAVLDDTGRQFEFLIGEPALRRPMTGEPNAMRRQRDRILDAMLRDHIRVGILPGDEPYGALAMCDIGLFDQMPDGQPPVVMVELPHAEVQLTAPDDTRPYVELVDLLWEHALTGDAAAALIADIL